MLNLALLVRLEAKPGKEKNVERFLRSAAALIAKAPDLFAAAPMIEAVEVLAVKLPK